MGLRGTVDGELIFQNCRVPRVNLLGAENGYFAVASRFVGLAMLGVAGISLGIARAAIDAATEHAKTRKIAGQPIGQFRNPILDSGDGYVFSLRPGRLPILQRSS